MRTRRFEVTWGPRSQYALRAVGAVALVAVALMLGLRAWADFSPQPAPHGWKVATGTTVSAQTAQEPMPGGGMRVTYSPIIGYTALEHGRVARRTTIGSDSPAQPQIGQEFRLGYNPASPTSAAVILKEAGVASGSLFAAGAVGAGAAGLLLAGSSIRSLRRRL